MDLLKVLEPLLPALAVVAVVTGLVYAGSARRSRRYRPGRPFDFTPVWFLAKPEQLAPADGSNALPAAPPRGELTATAAYRDEPVPGPLLAQPAAEYHGPTGGASDRW